MNANLQEAFTVSGTGLISGQPVEVRVERADVGYGIVFHRNGTVIPARFSSAVHLERGVTLGKPDASGMMQTLSIVEHFLCAAMIAGYPDLDVTISGGSELPILDGSAGEWLRLFQETWGAQTVAPTMTLPQPVFYRHNAMTALYALPAEHLTITYAIDFDHPELRQQWARWDSQTDASSLITNASTFGHVSELPALQAKGFALGVTEDNTLGLFEAGGYTRPLRYDGEPIYHKMLDLIGDLSLSGLNPLQLKAHIFALNAGHSSHVPFAQKLAGLFPPKT